MSTEANTQLLERAAACIDYFEGKLPAQLIELDLQASQIDLERLAYHVSQAEAVMANNELHNAGDIY